MTWDIFCAVVDNYGDIGITWRLSRQLADEHGIAVRLWVDDLAAFRRIRPEIDPDRAIQHLAGVEIRRWTTPLPDVEPGELVIEALACDLPEDFIARMAARRPSPVWLNLEYLSAEDWVEGVHGLPSPHPRLPLTKYFFMPGYTPATGGLPRERGLTARRQSFQADAEARAVFWAGLGLPGEDPETPRVSLFCYDNAALPGLLDAWAAGPRPIRLLVPEGKALPVIARHLGLAAPMPAGANWHRDALSLHVLPMLDQDAYDRLLWACDLNFVRGEDSFARAQWAARPLVWQAYRQDEEAHLAKLDAFLARLRAHADETGAADAADLAAGFWRAWNRESPACATLWPSFSAALPALAGLMESWRARLEKQPDLATNLLNFYRKLLK